jgi:hypothetical protein
MSDATLSELCPLTFGGVTAAGVSQTEPSTDGQLTVCVAGIPLPHTGLDTLLAAMDPAARQRLLEKERLIPTPDHPSPPNAPPQAN